MGVLGVIAILNINYFITYIAYSMIPPYFPHLAHEKGVEEQTVGFIMSFFYVAYSLTAYNLGSIIKCIGRKKATLLGLLIVAFTLSGMSLASRIEDKQTFIIVNAAIRFVHGGSQALVQATTYSIVGSVFPTEISKQIGYIEVSWGTGIAIGPVLAEYLYT